MARWAPEPVTGANSRARRSTWGGADEGCELGDCGAGNAEAGAEIVEERNFQFHAGLGESEHHVARLSAFFADRSAGDFALGDEGADVVFGGVGVEGDFGSFEHAQELFLAPEQAFQQMIEGGVAGSALEDAVELRAEEARLFRTRRELVILQAPIEPPDHPLGDLDGVALSVVGGDDLVNEALSVDPAQRVVADAETGRRRRKRRPRPRAGLRPRSRPTAPLR